MSFETSYSCTYLNMRKFLTIIILIFSTQLAHSQECNLNPERGSKNYIIGYGSLMDKDSRTRTNKSAFVVKPILIKGFERTWGLSGGMYKITFLTIIKKENSFVNAVYYPVSIKDLNKTDRRESGYCRVKVEGKDLSFYGKKIKTKNKNFWVYAANPGKIKNQVGVTRLFNPMSIYLLVVVFRLRKDIKLMNFQINV